jgi:hypothetical protein
MITGLMFFNPNGANLTKNTNFSGNCRKIRSFQGFYVSNHAAKRKRSAFFITGIIF